MKKNRLKGCAICGKLCRFEHKGTGVHNKNEPSRHARRMEWWHSEEGVMHDNRCFCNKCWAFVISEVDCKRILRQAGYEVVKL